MLCEEDGSIVISRELIHATMVRVYVHTLRRFGLSDAAIIISETISKHAASRPSASDPLPFLNNCRSAPQSTALRFPGANGRSSGVPQIADHWMSPF
jgi:hypothetical protein